MRQVDFWVKIKESEKINGYLDLARELKKKKDKTDEHKGERIPRGVVINVLDCDVLVSEFELHLRSNTLWKGMNPLILPAMGYIVSLLSFLKDGFSLEEPTKVDMPLNKETKASHKGDGDTSCFGSTLNSHQRPKKKDTIRWHS